MSERWVRARLVAGASAFAAVAIGVALLSGRLLIADLLHDSAVALAQGDLAPYAADLRDHPGEPPDPPGPGVQVGVEAGGAWLVDTLPEEVRSAVAGRAPGSFDVADDDDDHSWAVVGESVGTGDGLATIWAARDTTAANRSLSGIDVLFVLGGAGLVGLFAVASWLFVRSALRPVETARRRERRFVSDAAHELRTPLAALQGQLAVARRHLDEPAGPVALARAEQSAERLGELAANLLELARLDEGTPPGRASAGELRDAFLLAVDDVRATPSAGGVAIEQTSPAQSPDAGADLDAVSFGRIVRNLLANAVTAAGPGGAITAELRFVPGRLVLSIQDDGPGIPADLMPRALERFARADGTGSGLGLALVDALARSAGGEVSLTNTQPGLRAEVILPLR